MGVINTILLSVLAALALLAHGRSADAAEGASSLYIPGAAGDILLALSPEPGLQVSNGVLAQFGSVDTAVLQGTVDVGVDLDLWLDFFGTAYTFETPILGGTYTIGVAIPFGYAKLNAAATGPGGGMAGVKGDTFNLADIALVPLQLNWNVGNFHFKLAQSIIAPTGDYDTDDVINLGRNYWAFDTVGAVTWLNPETGTDISIAPGIMVNMRNEATDYRTGEEFHVDFTINQFLSETFAIGLRGYYYRQLTGDSGSGARLGDFMGESLGIGPGLFWAPKFAGGKLVIVGKILHDVKARNRLKSTYGSLGFAWKF